MLNTRHRKISQKILRLPWRIKIFNNKKAKNLVNSSLFLSIQVTYSYKILSFKLSHRNEFFLALLLQFFPGKFGKTFDILNDGLLQVIISYFRFVMRTTKRLFNNSIDKFMFQRIFRSQFQCVGCIFFMIPISP